MDLGGASTQVTVPVHNINEKVKLKKSNGTAKVSENNVVDFKNNIFVRSYLGYGTKQFLKQNLRNLKNKCRFAGKKLATECQSNIKQIFEKERISR